MSDVEQKKSGFHNNSIVKEVFSYVYIFVIVFGFKSMFFEPNHIPSGSMLPTMVIGDFILVNKFTYGLRIPFSETIARHFGGEGSIYLTKFRVPERGDIMVFEYPKDRNTLFVKRVIGLPGDKIEIVGKSVFVNGKEYEKTPLPNKEYYLDVYDRDGMISMDFMEFNLVNRGKYRHIVAYNNSSYHKGSEGIIEVPKGHLFMMGDNRDFSSDSRYWGFVPFSHVRGKAMFVWFNMVYPWSDRPFHFRPGRIGTTFWSNKN